jgi:hypothetical protein
MGAEYCAIMANQAPYESSAAQLQAYCSQAQCVKPRTHSSSTSAFYPRPAVADAQSLLTPQGQSRTAASVLLHSSAHSASDYDDDGSIAGHQQGCMQCAAVVRLQDFDPQCKTARHSCTNIRFSCAPHPTAACRRSRPHPKNNTPVVHVAQGHHVTQKQHIQCLRSPSMP